MGSGKQDDSRSNNRNYIRIGSKKPTTALLMTFAAVLFNIVSKQHKVCSFRSPRTPQHLLRRHSLFPIFSPTSSYITPRGTHTTCMQFSCKSGDGGTPDTFTATANGSFDCSTTSTHKNGVIEEAVSTLPFTDGSHRSAKVVITANQDASIHFRDQLQATIQACYALEKSSLWLYIAMDHCDLIASGKLYDLGFRFHHCTPDTAVLQLWLRSDTPSKIPAFSTHNVGVGALVVYNDSVLCVRELRKNYLPWKTPTGLADLGESIPDAAVREVMEETGIATRFHSILGFRQSHDMAHGQSDLFFVCRLDPVIVEDSSDMTPRPEASEIAEAAWVPLPEYRSMVQEKHPMMRHFLQVYEDESQVSIRKATVLSVVPGRGPNDIYLAKPGGGGQGDEEDSATL